MAIKKSNNYFKMFVKMTDYSVEAADELKKAFTSFNPEEMQEITKSMHKIEHEGDSKRHDLIEKLSKEFMTPIEREDIVQLADEIDNVIDCVEDTLLRTYMFNITEIREEALEFIEIIVKCVNALRDTVIDFENFRKSATIKKHIVEVNRLEEEGDKIYIKAMRRLYTDKGDPVSVLAWTYMFEQLEKCCDQCEQVADIIEDVIMKNS